MTDTSETTEKLRQGVQREYRLLVKQTPQIISGELHPVHDQLGRIVEALNATHAWNKSKS